MNQKSKRKNNYTSISIPRELTRTIVEIIKTNTKLGYRTKTEFIIEAIRRHIETIKMIEKNL